MLRKLFKSKKGSVVVMAIILTAGILVASVEFAIYAINSIRQARNIDRSFAAYYAAEAGAESALHQLRKRGATTLNPATGTINVGGTSAVWNLNTPDTFEETSDVLRIPQVAKNQTIHVPLYGNQGDAALDIHSMKVAWESESNCDAGAVPWVRSKAASWTGDALGIQWNDGANKLSNVKEYLKTPGGGAREVVFNDVTVDPSTSELFMQDVPLVVSLSPLYCDLRGVSVTFYDEADADVSPTSSIVPMTNMYTIRPEGDYQGVRQQVHLTLARRAGLSSLFDYVLFSERALQK